MSISKKDDLSKKLVWLLFLILTTSLVVNLVRQLQFHLRLNQKVTLEKKELFELEQKNKALKARLEEVQKPEFVYQQANKLFGVEITEKIIFVQPTTVPEDKGSTSEPKPEPTNWQKWWQLFVYSSQ